MPIRKKPIKYVKDPIVDMKNKVNKAKPGKRKRLWAREDEENILLYHFHKYKKTF